MKIPSFKRISREKNQQPNEEAVMLAVLRQKFVLAFTMMSLIPILVLGYVMVQYVLPHWAVELPTKLALLTWLVIASSSVGVLVVRRLVLPMARMVSQIQAIGSGEVKHPIETEVPGGEKVLGNALNQITERVRHNMVQLRAYGEETRQMNLEINRRILALSNVLQVNSLISQAGTLDEILTSILEKLSQLENLEMNCYLEVTEEDSTFLVRAASGNSSEQGKLLVHTQRTAPWLRQLIRERRTLVLDEENTPSPEGEIFQQQFGMTNAVCQPIVVLGKEQGILISANSNFKFAFQKDTLELLKIFSKQVSIVVENDLLSQRAKELEVKDELTGLYNASYIRKRLDEEIQRAARYHRSCALAVLNLDNFRQFRDQAGGLAAEKVLRQVAKLLQEHVDGVDRVGRMESDEFAVILPERNKRGTIILLEKIRLKLEGHIFAQGQNRLAHTLTISAGVSENPLDGDSSQVLFAKANEALKQAKSRGKNRVMAV